MGLVSGLFSDVQDKVTSGCKKKAKKSSGGGGLSMSQELLD